MYRRTPIFMNIPIFKYDAEKFHAISLCGEVFEF